MWIVLEDRLGRPFHVNDQMIDTIEPLADTRLHLTNGETKITRQSATEVVARMVSVRRALRVSGPELRPHREDVEAWGSG